jgi:YfiR/HmsC-like
MKDTFLTRLLLSMVLLFSSCLSADDGNLEFKVKAGYLYNFTKFVTWPEIKSPTFNLCLLGRDPFGDVIGPIEEKSAFARPIKLIRLGEMEIISNSSPLAECHIVYASNAGNLKTVFANMKPSLNITGILVVGSGEDFTAVGGMIGFVNRDGRIKLQINMHAIKQTGLKLSAKLLEIAELVKDGSDD